MNWFQPREYKTVKALRAGEVVEIEGVRFRAIEGEIQPGDWYVAERNTGPHLLTCRENDKENRWIVPVEEKYSFDTGECVRVEMVEEE